MEFLDNLDLDTKNRKAHRVRSWYLYEQYKSLEDHQLNAAQKLKDKSYQEKILRQELLERRARRKLCDQFSFCQSDSRIEQREKSDCGKATLSVSSEFFESFSEEENEQVTCENELQNFCSDDFMPRKRYLEELKMTDEREGNTSCTESANSILENAVPNDESDDCEFTKENEFTISQDLNKQMDKVKQDIESLENIKTIQDIDRVSDVSVCLDDSRKINKIAFTDNHEKESNNVTAIWSRLVSFAYQIVQLNHGNCYCDYSSQFLTAVLACDVLCRSVNRMCNILQPYVSPIKFATDESDAPDACRNNTTKKSAQSRKSRKTFEYKLFRRSKRFDKLPHRNYSENCSQTHYRRLLAENLLKTKKHSRASEPWRRVLDNNQYKERYSQDSSSSCSLWSHDNNTKSMSKSCSCHRKVMNPMLKLAHYIDSILKDVEESNSYL